MGSKRNTKKRAKKLPYWQQIINRRSRTGQQPHYHCSRSCPNFRWVDGKMQCTRKPGFKCRARTEHKRRGFDPTKPKDTK